MCSWTYVTSSCHFTSLGFDSGDVHLFSCTKINHHLVRIIRTLCRDRQKRLVFVHAFHTQYLLCDKIHSWYFWVTNVYAMHKHFSIKCLCTKIQYFIHTLLHTPFIQTFHTHANTKHKMSSKRYRRHFFKKKSGGFFLLTSLFGSVVR